MKKILTVIAFLIWLGIHAQPTLTKDWFPSTGSTFVMTRTIDTSLAYNTPPPNTGSNIIWDFSQLQLSNTKDSILYLDTSISYHVANCNLLLKEISNSITQLSTGTDTIIQFWLNQGITFYQFPVSYNSYFQSAGHSVDYYGAGSDISRSVSADGWGKLILPNDTFENTLRLKITTVENLNNGSPNGILSSYQSTKISYQWVHPSISNPLLKMEYHSYHSYSAYSPPPNNNITDSSVIISLLTSYQQIPNSVSENNYGNINCSVYPNPSHNNINIVFEGKTSFIYQLIITDLLGNTVLTAELKEHNNRIDLSSFSKGIYILKATGMNGCEKFVRKVVKE